MLLTDQDIKVITIIVFFISVFFIIKTIKRKKFEITKDIPSGKLGKVIKFLEEDGFDYNKTIHNLSYNIIADGKEYQANVAKRTVVLKKGFKRYILKIKNPKMAGKSINSKLIRYPFVEYGFLGQPNIIYYDYEKNKYRLITIPNLNKTIYSVIALLILMIIILIYFLIRRLTWKKYFC